jgi:hypothetical protein
VPPEYEPPHAVIVVGGMMRQIILTGVPLPFFKAMAQSRRGVVQVMEVQMRPLVVAIPRFIQIRMQQLNSNIATLLA